jgi:hypothetical protein
MKHILLVICWAGLALAKAQAQGTIYFNTRVLPDVDAKAYLPPDCTPLSGDGYSAQLYAGPLGSAESALQPVFPVTTFHTGVGAGYPISPGVVIIPGVAGGAKATLQLRVWDNEGGKIQTWEEALMKGASKMFDSPALGDNSASPPTTPANLVGLTSFGCVPEPSPLQMGMAAVALFFGARFVKQRIRLLE